MGYSPPISPRFKMGRLQSSYLNENLFKIGKSRKGAIFLDIGSCSESHGIIIATPPHWSETKMLTS